MIKTFIILAFYCFD